MGLIYRFHQYLNRFPGQHVDIVFTAPGTALSGAENEKDPPAAFRNIKAKKPGLCRNRKQDGLPGQFFFLAGTAISTDGQQGFLFPTGRNQQGSSFHGAQYVNMMFPQEPSASFRIFFPYQTVGKAGGEMFVVEDPDFHVPLFGFLQYNFHVRPPFGTAKILIRPGFHTESPAAAFPYFLNRLRQCLRVSFVLPEKRQQIIIGFSFSYLCQTLIHIGHPFDFS